MMSGRNNEQHALLELDTFERCEDTDELLSLERRIKENQDDFKKLVRMICIFL